MRTQFYSLFILIVLLTSTIGYGVFTSRAYLFGPSVTINTPQPYETNDTGIIEVSGVATNAVETKLLGRVIKLDTSGRFEETIALSPGINTVLVSVRDSFGSESEKHIMVTYVPKEIPDEPKKAEDQLSYTDSENPRSAHVQRKLAHVYLPDSPSMASLPRSVYLPERVSALFDARTDGLTIAPESREE
jgi:hypothetical protein